MVNVKLNAKLAMGNTQAKHIIRQNWQMRGLLIFTNFGTQLSYII